MENILDNINLLYERQDKIQKIINIIDNLPIYIHVIGQEKADPQSYICTALRQIETVNQLGITNDRIYLIYGEDFNEDLECKHKQGIFSISKRHDTKPLPKDINMFEITVQNRFETILTNILQNHTTQATPIIFGYDGHGYTDSGSSNGNMPLDQSQVMTDENLLSIFKKTARFNNPKLFIWTQCGSYDFVQRIKDKIPGFHLASTTIPNACGLGSIVMRDFTYKTIGKSYGQASKSIFPRKKVDLTNLTFGNYDTKFYKISTDPDIKSDTKISDYLNLKPSLKPIKKKV